MKINLDGKFCLEEAPWLDWGDIKYGFDHKFIDSGSVIQFAVGSLSINSRPSHYDLAMSDSNREEQVAELLGHLCEDVRTDTGVLKKVWIYIFLMKLYLTRQEYKDPLAVIEEIYADFDYPEYVSPIVRYMPIPDGEAAGNDEILRKWRNLLNTLREEINYTHHQ